MTSVITFICLAIARGSEFPWTDEERRSRWSPASSLCAQQRAPGPREQQLPREAKSVRPASCTF